MNTLKRLLEGRAYAYPVKCELDKNIQFYGPVIFVSNFNIEDECQDEALLGRLINIQGNCRLDVQANVRKRRLLMRAKRLSLRFRRPFNRRTKNSRRTFIILRRYFIGKSRFRCNHPRIVRTCLDLNVSTACRWNYMIAANSTMYEYMHR